MTSNTASSPAYKNQQFISVVIPVYNEEKTIKECLDCLAQQTRQADVVYVIDNNCNDLSMDIARAYPFVTIVHQSTQGICASTKAGFDIAAKHGGLILRLDADCRPPADWISRISSLFEKDSKVIAATGPGEAYDANTLVKFLINVFYMRPYFFLVGSTLGQKPLFGSNFAIRAKNWKSVGPHTHLASHQDIHDDIDISFHLVGKGKVVYDRSNRMPISSRPFHTSFLKLIDRYVIGFRSIFIHWPKQMPWKNWWVNIGLFFKS
jgi:glycosyltransferase involved in cell wall biosynthesis